MSSISATNPATSNAYVQSSQSKLATNQQVTPPQVQVPAVKADADGDNDGSSSSSKIDTYA